MNPPYLKQSAEGVYLALRVQPRASRNKLAGQLGAELKLQVTAPPVDSAANEAVTRFLAEELGLSRRAVLLVKGQTSRSKTVFLAGVTAGQIAAKLGWRHDAKA